MPTVPVKRENRRIMAVAVALIRLLVPVAAPVILARMVCPASRSLVVLNPGLFCAGTPGWRVRIPKSTENVAVGLTVNPTPLPKPALANGEPLVMIELSLMISPKFDPPLQLLG